MNARWREEAMRQFVQPKQVGSMSALWREEALARARMEVAAPELLAALREMLAAVELEGADGQRFFEARNAGLAACLKAEGR